MTILQALEHTKRDSVVNVFNWALTAPFTYSAAPFYNRNPGWLPADSITSRRSSLPSRVRLSTLKLGLPFSHAGRIAERENGMEVCRCPGYALPTPIAWLGDLVGPPWVWLPNLPDLPTGEGAIFLPTLTSATTDGTAHLAGRLRLTLTPTIIQVASGGTKQPVATPVEGVKRSATAGALKSHIQVSHTVSIPHIEIEERYCEIAAKRLSQEVFEFTAPEPVAVQDELFGGQP